MNVPELFNIYNVDTLNDLIKKAIASGNFRHADILLQQFPEYKEYILKESIFQNSINMLNYIINTYPEDIDFSVLLLYAITHGTEKIQNKLRPLVDNDVVDLFEDKIKYLLIKCVLNNNIKKLIQLSTYVKKLNFNNNLLFRLAARYGFCNLLSHFITLNLPLNAEIFYEVCQSGHYDCLQLLHDHIDKKTIDYNIAVNKASSSSNFKVIDFLFKHGTDFEPDKLIIIAASRGNIPIIKHIVSFFEIKDFQLASDAFVQAATNGHLSCLQYLVDHLKVDMGLDLSALQNAVINGHTPVVEYLISSGAYLDQSLLKLALQHDHSKIVKLLLENGLIAVTTPTTFINLAIINHNFENIKHLHELGNIDIYNIEISKESIDKISTDRNTDIIEYLITHGANINYDRLFHNIIKYGNTDLLSLLLTVIDNVNLEDLLRDAEYYGRSEMKPLIASRLNI